MGFIIRNVIKDRMLFKWNLLKCVDDLVKYNLIREIKVNVIEYVI